MKRLIATGIFIFLISCKQKEVTTEYLIDSTIEVYKKELPKNIIFFRGKGNINVKDTKNFSLLDAKGLLKRNDENFLCLGVTNNEKLKMSTLLSFKTGKGFTCTFDNEGKLLSKKVVQTKLQENKPYYIYYEILKRKYPDYMNWKLFPIPKDSLK